MPGSAGEAMITVCLIVAALVVASYPVIKFIGMWMEGEVEGAHAGFGILLYICLIAGVMGAPGPGKVILVLFIVASAVMLPTFMQVSDTIQINRMEDDSFAMLQQALVCRAGVPWPLRTWGLSSRSRFGQESFSSLPCCISLRLRNVGQRDHRGCPTGQDSYLDGNGSSSRVCVLFKRIVRGGELTRGAAAGERPIAVSAGAIPLQRRSAARGPSESDRDRAGSGAGTGSAPECPEPGVASS